jgi:hypothetical protein
MEPKKEVKANLNRRKAKRNIETIQKIQTARKRKNVTKVEAERKTRKEEDLVHLMIKNRSKNKNNNDSYKDKKNKKDYFL